MSDRFAELDALIWADEMADKLAALSSKEFGQILQEYQRLRRHEQILVDAEIKRRHTANLATQIDAKLERLESMPLHPTENEKKEAERLLQEVSELKDKLEAHWRKRREGLALPSR